MPFDISRKGDLEADKYRVRVFQDVVEKSKSASNPFGDAVLVISEARKPASTNETRRQRAWGQGLAELMGSARLGYAADAVLLYRRMDDHDITEFYGLEGGEVELHRERLDRSNTSPTVLTLEKGRDGTTRGEIPMEFDFHRSRFRELQNGQPDRRSPVQFPRQRPTIPSRLEGVS